LGSCNSNCCEATVTTIVEKYGRDRRNLIPLLHDLQDELGYLSPEVMETVADQLGTTSSQVHGVATFYTLFYTKPQGKYVVRLCDSPPCHIEGSKSVRKAVEEALGVSEGQTSDDGLFTFEIVSCMGLCGVAPAVMVNDDVYGNLTPEMIPSIVGKYREVPTGSGGISESRPRKETN